MATAKDCHTLTSYYVTCYKEKYGENPVVNRVTARWNFDPILAGMSIKEVKALLDYYFTITSAKRHSLDWFFYNYDKLIETQKSQERDAERRRQIREESKQRAKEWRESGRQGITSS